VSETPDFHAYPLSELSKKIDADFRARRRFYDGKVIADTAWNDWRFDPDRLALDLYDSEGRYTYEVDLERCVDSAHVLNRLVQVSGKGWGQHDMAKVTAGLLRALDDIFHLQANVCPSHEVLTGQKISELVSVFLQRFHAGEQP
jgi:hypothetical protein